MSIAAIASATKFNLVSRQKVAESTVAFRLERPSGGTFQAGQFLDMTLLAPSETDAEGDTRAFSIASAPHEETLMVATRLRESAFKRVLMKMPLGTAVTIAGPSGDLTLDHNVNRPAVFLAGGIGITPFRSIVLHAAKAGLPQRMYLFYSNRRPEDAPFLEELQALEKTNPNYKLIASMTKMEKSTQPWQGETGHIDKEMLARHVNDPISPIYYIAGPTEMVRGLLSMVRDIGVNDTDIRAEEFAGYEKREE